MSTGTFQCTAKKLLINLFFFNYYYIKLLLINYKNLFPFITITNIFEYPLVTHQVAYHHMNMYILV